MHALHDVGLGVFVKITTIPFGKSSTLRDPICMGISGDSRCRKAESTPLRCFMRKALGAKIFWKESKIAWPFRSRNNTGDRADGRPICGSYGSA
jgi:hypothetical protein